VEYRSSTATESDRPVRPGGTPPRKGRGKAPWWARLMVIFGALMMIASGGLIIGYKSIVAQATSGIRRADLLPDAPGRQHITINGPKNILLVGVDSRPGQNPNEPVRADSIIILHVPSQHDRGFLVSLPRDSYVQIPAFDNGKTRTSRHEDKINAAFADGGLGLTGDAGRAKA